MRIGFLLGAGISLPAGLPSTEELTRRVFRVLHSDGSFVKRLDHLPGDRKKELALAQLLEKLRCLCDQYFTTQ